MLNSKCHLFVYVHDIGSAQIINALYAKLSAKFDISLFASSLAYNFLNRQRCVSVCHIASNEDPTHYLAKRKNSKVLIGTSNDVLPTKLWLSAAKALNLKSIAFIDQWQSYKERFYYQQKFYQPDKILVPDSISAHELTLALKQAIKIECVGQPFLNSQYYGSMRCRRQTKQKRKIVFISEPISKLLSQQQYMERYGYSEQQALNFLRKMMPIAYKGYKLDVRKHPKQGKQKSGFQLTNYSTVIGMSSTMLIDAYLQNLPVVTLQPQAHDRPDHFLLSRIGIMPRCTNSREFLKAIKRRHTRKKLEFERYTLDDFVNALAD